MLAKELSRAPRMCAYCAVAPGTEVEHVFPESWYPDGTSASLMITVPSCGPCNRSYGVLEDRLRLPLVAGLARNSVTRGVVERALRAVDPMAAHSLRDATFRAARLRSIQRRVRILTSPDELDTAMPAERNNTLGPMTTLAGLHVVGLPSVSVDPDELSRLAVKFVKGAYFAKTGEPLPPSMPCGGSFVRIDVVRELSSRLHFGAPEGPPPFRFRAVHSRGDGAHPAATFWAFLLWERVCCLGWTGPDDEELPAGD